MAAIIIKPAIESYDIPYEKFRILFVNVFTILHKAATLNPRKLGKDIFTIRQLLATSSQNPIIAQLYILFISSVLFAKFFMGYVGLSANIIAMLPILADEAPELLTPSIIAQVVENIFFTTLDIVLGTVTVRYFMPCKYPVYFIFLAQNLLQISIGMSKLNLYRDFYNSLSYNNAFSDSQTVLVSGNEPELFLRKESLI